MLTSSTLGYNLLSIMAGNEFLSDDLNVWENTLPKQERVLKQNRDTAKI